MANTVFWIGTDGNVWFKDGSGVKNVGRPIKIYENGFDAQLLSAESNQIPDPNPGGATLGATTDVGDGGGSRAQADPDAGQRSTLKNRIAGRGNEIDAAYGSLFGDLNSLVSARDAELETQYGGQLKKASDQFTEALPMIDQSYAAIGSYDSTQRNDSRGKAKKGFEETTQTIETNKGKDKAALGQYKREQEAKFTADKEAAKRAVASAGETTDVGALRSLSNDLDTNLSATGVTKATLGTEGAAKKAVTDLTGDNGRFDAAINALDSIIKSSMGSDVKAAAVKAVTDSAGLTDEEKKKVQAQYGNVYEEQAAL
jgi:hypothetical protein